MTKVQLSLNTDQSYRRLTDDPRIHSVQVMAINCAIHYGDIQTPTWKRDTRPHWQGMVSYAALARTGVATLRSTMIVIHLSTPPGSMGTVLWSFAVLMHFKTNCTAASYCSTHVLLLVDFAENPISLFVSNSASSIRDFTPTAPRHRAY